MNCSNVKSEHRVKRPGGKKNKSNPLINMKKKLPTPNYYYVIRQTFIKEIHVLYTGWLCLTCQTENQPTKKC